jgi:tetratricopeptide (TPR) repeat protein
MKRISIITFIIMSFWGTLSAQEFRTLGDFIAMEDTSDLVYYTIISEPEMEEAQQQRLNFRIFYRFDSAGHEVVNHYRLSENEKLYEQAVFDATEVEMYDTALHFVNKLIDLKPGYSKAYLYRADIYRLMEKNRLAKKDVLQAVAINPIDFEGWLGLSVIYAEEGNLDSAVMAASRAWIFNRNDEEAELTLASYYDESGGKYTGWRFNPQFEHNLEDTMVKLKYQPVWQGWALCDAFWQYEADPLQGLNKEYTYSELFRTRECLSCLLYTMRMNKKEIDKEPQLNGLWLAAQSDQLSNFLIFEIMLPKEPELAFQLSKQRVASLISYIKLTRTGN